MVLFKDKRLFDALDGLFLETALLVPISLIWLQFSHVASSSMAFWVSSEICGFDVSRSSDISAAAFV